MSKQEPVIVIKDLYKSFKLPHEQHNGIKQLIVNFTKRKKGYEVQHVLDDVSFEVNKGEFFGIVGRNGSGKSTLLKLLAGIYVPDKGLIQVNGSITPFIELGVGFNPELTGRENVFMNGAMLGFSHKEMDGMYDGIVEFAELEKFMDQKLKNYSSGMQVRLAFSIAIRAQGDILIIDEVLAVGDAAFQQKCFDYFEKLKKEKKTIIIVTHDMSAVKRFCTNAVYVVNGKIVKKGDPLEIASLYAEANIEKTKDASGTSKISKLHKLQAKITEQTDSSVLLKLTYSTEDKSRMYIGFSVLKDGISIAEMTTSLQKPLTGTGEVLYRLNTGIFNGGVYQIEAALFKLDNRELIAVNSNRNIFTIKGMDITRGAAVKLADTWEYR